MPEPENRERDREDGDVEALIAERRAASPRRTPDRDPAGAAHTRRWLAVTAVTVLAASLVLLAVVVVGRA